MPADRLRPPRSSKSTAAGAHLAPLALALLIGPRSEGAERALYFVDRAAHSPLSAPLVADTVNDVSLTLELRSFSIEDQNQLAPLVIDDYRYDEETYFVDHRKPNVRFEVMSVSDSGLVRPARYRVGSQGGGASLQYLHVNAWFQLGRSPMLYWLVDRIGYAGYLFAKHAPGTYRIRAFHQPQGSAELATPPVLVIIR